MKLHSFLHTSLDGYYASTRGDMGWAQSDDPEWQSYVEANASEDGSVVLGGVTYEMMASFWPTDEARRIMPEVAERMNALPKLVFSRSPYIATWANSEVVSGDAAARMRALKAERSGTMTVLGSGQLLTAFAKAGLIDEYQFVVNPVALGAGKRLFDGISSSLPLRLIDTRRFRNGKVVLVLHPDVSGLM